MRARQLTLKQASALHYLSRIGGKASTLDIRSDIHATTLNALAQDGYLSVRVRMTQKAWNRLHASQKAGA